MFFLFINIKISHNFFRFRLFHLEIVECTKSISDIFIHHFLQIYVFSSRNMKIWNIYSGFGYFIWKYENQLHLQINTCLFQNMKMRYIYITFNLLNSSILKSGTSYSNLYIFIQKYKNELYLVQICVFIRNMKNQIPFLQVQAFIFKNIEICNIFLRFRLFIQKYENWLQFLQIYALPFTRICNIYFRPSFFITLEMSKPATFKIHAFLYRKVKISYIL